MPDCHGQSLTRPRVTWARAPYPLCYIASMGRPGRTKTTSFSLDDATYGVDATNTDWNAQACLSAKGYLKMEPFSHAGLVEQLSSAYGAQFTPDQAEFGVTCAGL